MHNLTPILRASLFWEEGFKGEVGSLTGISLKGASNKKSWLYMLGFSGHRIFASFDMANNVQPLLWGPGGFVWGFPNVPTRLVNPREVFIWPQK